MVKTRRKRKLPVSTADYGPPERHQRGEVELIAVKMGAGNAVQHAARNKYEHVLDRYLVGGKITHDQHEAGMVVRSFWEASTLTPQRLSMDMSRTIRGQSADTPDSVIHAKKRLGQILDVCSREEYALLIAVCGHGEWATNAAPRNRAMDMLRAALDSARQAWRMR